MKATNVLTTREAALRLGISLRRLMSLIAEGKLPGSYKVGLSLLLTIYCRQKKNSPNFSLLPGD